MSNLKYTYETQTISNLIIKLIHSNFFFKVYYNFHQHHYILIESYYKIMKLFLEKLWFLLTEAY